VKGNIAGATLLCTKTGQNSSEWRFRGSSRRNDNDPWRDSTSSNLTVFKVQIDYSVAKLVARSWPQH
jgi:hypothetical protein